MPDTEKTSTEDVRSRLWQDPFEAAELHRKRYHTQDQTSHIIVSNKHSSSKLEFQTKKEESAPVSSTIKPKFSYQLDRIPQRICNSGKKPPARAHTIEELLCQIEKYTATEDEPEKVHVVAVMVPGGPYANDQEWRLRSRYAVISGMNSAGYIPKDAGHIGYVDFKHKCIEAIKTKNREDDAQYCDWPPYMPYEWFLPSNSDFNKPLPTLQNHPDRVLVLWLNNNAFADNEDPLNMLGLLKRIITPQHTTKIEISFNVIGPHDSITL